MHEVRRSDSPVFLNVHDPAMPACHLGSLEGTIQGYCGSVPSMHSIGQGYICAGDEVVTLGGLPIQRPRQDGSQSILFYPLRQTYSMADRHLSLHQSSGWRMAMKA